LQFCVRLDKNFLGKDALLAQREQSPTDESRLVCLRIDDIRQVVLGNEPVRIGGEVVGRVTSGAPGYTVNASIAFAYVPASCTALGTPAQILVFGTWVAATVATSPLWDPANERILG